MLFRNFTSPHCLTILDDGQALIFSKKCKFGPSSGIKYGQQVWRIMFWGEIENQVRLSLEKNESNRWDVFRRFRFCLSIREEKNVCRQISYSSFLELTSHYIVCRRMFFHTMAHTTSYNSFLELRKNYGSVYTIFIVPPSMYIS
jgi:hypothetical protein